MNFEELTLDQRMDVAENIYTNIDTVQQQAPPRRQTTPEDQAYIMQKHNERLLNPPSGRTPRKSNARKRSREASHRVIKKNANIVEKAGRRLLPPGVDSRNVELAERKIKTHKKDKSSQPRGKPNSSIITNFDDLK